MRAVLEGFRARITDHEEIVTNGPVRAVVPPGWVVIMVEQDANFVLSRDLFARLCPGAVLNTDTGMYEDGAPEAPELTDEQRAAAEEVLQSPSSATPENPPAPAAQTPKPRTRRRKEKVDGP